MKKVRLWIAVIYLMSTTLRNASSAVSTCRARIEGTSGTFTSPNFPHSPISTSSPTKHTFPDNGRFVTCQWELIVPPGMAIELQFGAFDMASKGGCDKGEVEIFSGLQKNKQSLDKYCPEDQPHGVVLPNNTATVTFKRPSDFGGKGFLISFIATKPHQSVHDFVTCSETVSVQPRVQSFSIVCPSGCAGIKDYDIYGVLKYKDTSKLCLAAIHAGVITDARGGRVQVKRGSSHSLYNSATANNITSSVSSYSEVSIYFPAVEECSDRIMVNEKQFSASSYWNETINRKKFKLWLPGKADYPNSEGWTPSNPKTVQWIEIDFLKVKNITGIITQGSSSRPYRWCESYKVRYSNNGITWDYYKEANQRAPKLFTGNSNHFGQVRNNLINPRLIARYVRLYPTPVTNMAHRYALSIMFKGCEATGPRPEIFPTTTTTTTTRRTTTTKLPEIIATTTSSSTTQPTTTTASTTVTSPLLPLRPPITDVINGTKKPNLTVSARPPTVTDEPVSRDTLNERSIIIIAIVAALAVTSILLAALVLILVRKRKKEPKIETIVPKHHNSQTNATYHAGIDSARFYSSKKDEKKGSEKKKDQKFLFKNYNYADSYPVTAPQEQMSLQNSRGGVTLLYDEQRHNGELLRAPSDVPGPSNGMLQHRSAHEGSDSFQSDDEDHEYQVIPDHVTDYVNPRTSSKASTVSSHHSKKSETGSSWQHGAMWGNAGDAWGKEQAPVFSPSPMSSFGGLQSQRSRSGTFPNPIHNSIQEPADAPFSPGPPKTAPPSFTAPRFPHRKRGGSRSPEHPSVTSQLITSSTHRSSSSSGGSSFDMTSHADPVSAAYYSHVPEAHPSGHIHGPNSAHQVAPEGMWSTGGHHPRKQASYKTPRSHAFSTIPSNGDGDIPRHNGFESALRRSTSRGSQSSGYDQLYRPKNAPPSGENGKCMVAMTMNNYNQLNLQSPV